MGEKTAHFSKVNPEFGMFCNHGKAVIANLEPPPEPLRLLLEDDGAQGKEFRNNMWYCPVVHVPRGN
jgi:hypothetical protein